MTLNRFGDGTGGTNGPGIKSAPVNDNFAALFDYVLQLNGGGSVQDLFTHTAANARVDNHVAGGNTTVYMRGNDADNSFEGIGVWLPYLDACNDSSIDSTIWTTNTIENDADPDVNVTSNVTESSVLTCSVNVSQSGAQISDGTAQATTNGSTGIDFKAANGEYCLIYRHQNSQTNGIGTGDALSVVELIGSTSGAVVIDQVLRTPVFGDLAANETWRFIHLVVDASSNEATVYVNNSSSGTTLDLSSLSGTNWYFRVRARFDTGDAGGSKTYSMSTQLHGIAGFQVGDSAQSLVYDSGNINLNDTRDSAYFKTDIDRPTGLTVQVSTNGGSNYSTVTDLNGQLLAATAGTEARVRITGNSPTTINYPNRTAAVLESWRGLFN